MHALCTALGLQPGEQAVVTNGRVLKLPAGRSLWTGEYALMEYVAFHLQPGAAVLRAMRKAQEHGRTSYTGADGAALCVRACAGTAASFGAGHCHSMHSMHCPSCTAGQSCTPCTAHLAGAEELSSEELSDLALLAASIAARPSSGEGEDPSADELFSESNMQRSAALQSFFDQAEGPAHMRVSSAPGSLAPVIQVHHFSLHQFCC
jgi:hypothetical protein